MLGRRRPRCPIGLPAGISPFHQPLFVGPLEVNFRLLGQVGLGKNQVVVRRVGESVWILRPTEALEHRAVEALRDTFLEAVDSGAENLVVDLSEVETIAAGGAETILAMADLMRGRSRTFWLAARSSDGEVHTLRAVYEDGRKALLGVSAALDAALERLPPDVQHDRHHPEDGA